MQGNGQKISPIKQRILQFAKTLNISKRSFYEKIGVSRGTLESNTGITEDVVVKFIATYPQVSLEWLIRGEGEMLNPATESDEKNLQTKCAENVTLLKGNTKGNEKGNKRNVQKTLPNDSSAEPPFSDHATEILTAPDGSKIRVDLHTPKATKTDSHGEIRPTPAEIAADVRGAYIATSAVSVPVVDIEAAAGGGAVNSDYFDESEVLRFPSSMLSPTSSKRLCINVRGESMEPTIFDGTRIVVRLLDRSEWARIRSGDVYVVTDREGNTFVKRLRNNLDMSGKLTLISDNPNQRKYSPFQLYEDEIFNVWTVELVISDSVPPSERDQIDDLRDEMRELREWIRGLQSREK